MPFFAAIYLIISLSSLGMPPLNGFVGEFTILLGAWQVNRWWAVGGVIGIVLGAAYLLWLYQRVMFGEVTNPKNKDLRDVNLRELATLIPLVVACFWIGLQPKPFFEVMDKPVMLIMERVQRQPEAPPVAVALPPAEKEKVAR
jgi:NADH-quinone oxidoreductase subunit M